MRASTVLLIDDDCDSIAIYSLILRHHGFTVLEAFDSSTGLRLAEQHRPDLVVSETFLPGVEPKAYLELLHGSVLSRSIPIIMLDSTPALGRNEGSFSARNRLTKPCEPSVLLEEVKRLLQQEPAPA